MCRWLLDFPVLFKFSTRKYRVLTTPIACESCSKHPHSKCLRSSYPRRELPPVPPVVLKLVSKLLSSGVSILAVPRSLSRRNPAAAAPHPVQRSQDPWHLRFRALSMIVSLRVWCRVKIPRPESLVPVSVMQPSLDGAFALVPRSSWRHLPARVAPLLL